MNSFIHKFSISVVSVVVLFGIFGAATIAHADDSGDTGWYSVGDSYDAGTGWYSIGDSYGPETGWYSIGDSYSPETAWYSVGDSYSPETGWYSIGDSYSPETGWYSIGDSYSPEYDYACGCYDGDYGYGVYEETYYDSGCDCYSYSSPSYRSGGSRGFSFPAFASSGYSSVRPMSFGSPSYPVYNTPAAPAKPTGGNTSSSVSNVTNTTVTNIDNSINDSFNNYNSGVIYGNQVTGINTTAVAALQPVTPQYHAAYVQPTYHTPTYPQHPAPYVSLSQIPYTGFDFGTVGNAMYWVGLAIFALGAGYLAVYYVPALAFAGSRSGKRFAPIVAEKAPILVEKETIRTADGVQSIANSIRKAGTLDSMAIVDRKDGSMPKIVISRE